MVDKKPKTDQNQKISNENSKANSPDLQKLRLSQNFHELVGVKKQITTISVRKPNKQEFIRIRSGDQWRLETAVLELKEERETYLLDATIWDELFGEWIPKVLYTAINRSGILFIWPIKLPGPDGKLDQWNLSALEAAEMAQDNWVRVSSNMELGAYEILTAQNNSSEPEWPNLDFQKIINIAFKDKFITDTNHHIIQKLKGEI